MPTSHPGQAFLCKCFRNPTVLTLCTGCFQSFFQCVSEPYGQLETKFERCEKYLTKFPAVKDMCPTVVF